MAIEFAIRPDYVGKNLPTRRDEMVDVHADGVDLGEIAGDGDLGEIADEISERSRGMEISEWEVRLMRHNGARHLLSMADLDRDDIEQILNLTGSFAEGERSIPKVPRFVARPLPGCSMKTQPAPVSASRRRPSGLSADTMNFSVSSSSVNKGESLRDTIETIAAMGIDGVVVRHRCRGATAGRRLDRRCGDQCR